MVTCTHSSHPRFSVDSDHPSSWVLFSQHFEDLLNQLPVKVSVHIEADRGAYDNVHDLQDLPIVSCFHYVHYIDKYNNSNNERQGREHDFERENSCQNRVRGSANGPVEFASEMSIVG